MQQEAKRVSTSIKKSIPPDILTSNWILNLLIIKMERIFILKIISLIMET